MLLWPAEGQLQLYDGGMSSFSYYEMIDIKNSFNSMTVSLEYWREVMSKFPHDT